MDDTTRRTFLRGVGVTTAVGVAGCSGGGDDGGDGGETLPADDYPSVDEWLTETDLGGADSTYDGTLLDRRDQDTLTIQTGASGNDGNFAFAPSAVVVSAGTEVEWSWTGEGSPHNVEAAPDEQLDASDYQFSSGDSEGGSGVKFTHTMDEAGLALYHCEPHLTFGMKGGIAVEQ